VYKQLMHIREGQLPTMATLEALAQANIVDLREVHVEVQAASAEARRHDATEGDICTEWSPVGWFPELDDEARTRHMDQMWRAVRSTTDGFGQAEIDAWKAYLVGLCVTATENLRYPTRDGDQCLVFSAWWPSFFGA